MTSDGQKSNTGCDKSVLLRFLSSRNIWSADPYSQQQQQWQKQHRFFISIRWTKAQAVTMNSKSPSRHWKTIDWKTSVELKTLEKEQADLLKLYWSTQIADLLKAAEVALETKVFRSVWQWNQAYARGIEQSFEMGSWQSTISPRHWKFPRIIRCLLEKHNSKIQICKSCLPNFEWTIKCGKEVENRKFRLLPKEDIV